MTTKKPCYKQDNFIQVCIILMIVMDDVVAEDHLKQSIVGVLSVFSHTKNNLFSPDVLLCFIMHMSMKRFCIVCSH